MLRPTLSLDRTSSFVSRSDEKQSATCHQSQRFVVQPVHATSRIIYGTIRSHVAREFQPQYQTKAVGLLYPNQYSPPSRSARVSVEIQSRIPDKHGRQGSLLHSRPYIFTSTLPFNIHLQADQMVVCLPWQLSSIMRKQATGCPLILSDIFADVERWSIPQVRRRVKLCVARALGIWTILSPNSMVNKEAN